MIRARNFQGGHVQETQLDILLDACSKGSVEDVESILEAKKVDLKTISWLYKSPLYVAVSHYISDDVSPEYRRIVELLLQHGADPFQPDFDRWTVAMKVFRDKPGLAELLIKYMNDPNRRLSKCGSTALHLAVQHCSIDIVKKLLDKRADVNTNIHKCAPVFHVAVMCDRHDLINLLIKHGADPKKPSDKGSTVLHSVESGEMVRKMMRYGLDINAKAPPEGDTPLRSSILGLCNDDVIKALLECGADYKMKNNDGFTAFDFIIKKIRSLDYVHTLVRMGKILVDYVESNVPEDVNDEETRRIRQFGEELKLLKTKEIGNSSVTFWKLINTKPRKAASFFRNEGMLRSPDISKFIFFGPLIRRRIGESLEFHVLESHARDLLNETPLKKLPWNCMDIIISYFSLNELRNIKLLSAKKKKK